MVAAFSIYRGDTDLAFETGVLAACSFFLSYRFQIKDRIAAREDLEYEEMDDEPDELSSGLEDSIASENWGAAKHTKEN